MFTKWFKRKSVPDNDGNSALSKVDRLHYSKLFEIELSNMEGTPIYALTHQLSIGSEIGNIIIADPSVSPRHASFILQEEVVSIIDHGSVAGTMVNKAKIPSGKYIILEETDVVNIGDLEVKLRVSNVSTPAEEIPELPAEEKPAPAPTPAPTPEPKKVKVVEAAPAISSNNFDAKGFLSNAGKNKKNKTKKKSLNLSSSSAANSLVRVLAVTGDFLIAYILILILQPFDEFRDFLTYVPDLVLSNIPIDWNFIWKEIEPFISPALPILQEAYNVLDKTLDVLPLFVLFVIIRLLSTLCFGVSISELMLGVRSFGNGIWARIGGVIRVLIGVVTGPFIIFDFPSLFSKKTFKEFVTYTNTILSSKFVAILGVVFYFPFLIVLILLAPLVRGLEVPTPIIISDKIDQRVKVKLAESEVPVEVKSTKDSSVLLKLELEYNPDELTLIPSFKFQGVKEKLNLKSGLVFYQRDLKRPVEFEVYKTFSLKQLLGIAMKGNVFLFEKYPEIYNFVYASENTNPTFKAVINPKAQTAFADQFITLTNIIFSLGIDNALEILQSETFLIKGLIDYKESFLSLIEFKDFSKIGYIKIGNTVFMKVSYSKQKPFDLLIPLIKDDGIIYKVTFDKNENLADTTSKFYKFNLVLSSWVNNAAAADQEVLSPLQVVDLFSASNLKKNNLTPSKAQSLYAYYFEASSAILTRGDFVELEVWKNSLSSFRKLLDSLPVKALIEGEEDFKVKLQQNFRDISDALENKNFEYFGISKTTTL